jgi:glycosyltransferase involved in cell wall biosynthesis
MRILMTPLICTKQEVFRESEFITFFQIAKQWKEHYCIMAVPDLAVIPEDFKLPNLQYYRTRSWFHYNLGKAHVDTCIIENFAPLGSKNFVDFVLTSRSTAAVNLQKMLYAGPGVKVPVVVLDSWVTSTIESESDYENILRASAYATLPVIFLTSRERDFALNMSKKFLSPLAVAKARSSCLVQSAGVPLKKIQSVVQSVQKFDKFTLTFAGRFNPNKRWEEVLSTYKTFVLSHPNSQAKAIKLGVTEAQVEVTSHLTNVEFLEPLPYEGYVELLCKSHLFLSCSVDEGFSFGWSEKIATGNPVILPEKTWAIELVGKEYPFMYSSRSEMLKMLEYCYHNYNAAQEMVKPFSEKYVEKHDIEYALTRILSYASKSIEGSYGTFKDWEPRLREVLDELPSTFSLSEFVKAAKVLENMEFDAALPQYGITSNRRNLVFWLRKFCDELVTSKHLFRKKAS